MDLSTPHVLTKLPRSSRPDAAVSFSKVVALKDGSSRHRNEICAAVDGDSLTIYSVRDGSIVASHPVPPTSSFSGPPLSVFSKTDTTNVRRTYCAITHNTLHLQAFETIGKEFQNSKTYTSPDLAHKESPLIALELISNDDENRNYILTIQLNGAVTVLSEDLSTIITRISLTSSAPIHIVGAQCLSSTIAAATVLQQRSDLLIPNGPQCSYVALAYTIPNSGDATPSKIFYGLWPINVAAVNETSILPLFEHDLGLQEYEATLVASKRHSCTFRLHARYLDLKGPSLQSFELSGVRPIRVYVSSNKQPISQQTMAISKKFALSSSQEALRLWDLEFETTQAILDLKTLNRKRKLSRTGIDSHGGQIELVTWYHKLGRVIGRRRNHLVAIDITSEQGSKKVLESGTRLIDNIGKGVSLQDKSTTTASDVQVTVIGPTNVSANLSLEWRHTKKILDRLAQAGDVSQFENTFMSMLSDQSLQAVTQQQQHGDLSASQVGVPTTYVDYVLSKVFERATTTNPTADAEGGVGNAIAAENGDPGHSQLRVKLKAERLILWLSRFGSLSTHRVNIAMSPVGEIKQPLGPDAVAQALVELDPTLNLLSKCLQNGFTPYVNEQSSIVLMLIQIALSGSGDSNQVGPSDERNPEFGQLDRLERPSPSAWVSDDVKRALVLALNRFGAAGPSTISSCLRKDFAPRELLALVQFLRQQLFQSGHTRSFQSQQVEPHSEEVVSLDAIVRVLSSCVDAIGPLGFFGSLENEDFIESIVPDLVSEIDNAKKGLEDATDLQGVLREILRYQESLQKHHDAQSRVSRIESDGEAQQPGTIITLYSEGVDGREAQDVQLLPLSSRAEDLINPFKVRKGGGQVKKRSSRHISMLEQRQKGVYSFERLIL
ncbi:hypothetical protein B0A52_05438 [Exophiala mesophila]|uniref:Utp8 beta-propeller domain-containing protein n=1 Tax=Exophiala mesophila TaxID=212818 RepID=A0A438N4X6_EXOME|nr:hypothetical protein B0A52_05438 [Exophiala mesophila]